jgi:hypothetical protein
MKWIPALASSFCLLVSAPAAQPPPDAGGKRFDVARLLQEFDKNKDGVLDRSETPERIRQHFEQIDVNKDGKLSKEELERVADRLARQQGGRPGEFNAPPARGERLPEKLMVGDPAPDFTLPDAAGKKEVTLSSARGKKPVVLIFGSCT